MDAEEGGLYIGRAYDAALASPIFQVDGDAFSGDANYAAEEGGWSAAAAPASDGAAAIWGVADIIKLSLAEHAPLLQLSVSSSGPSRMGWPRPSQQRLEEIAAEAAAHRRKRTAPAPAAGAPLPTRPATDETLASARAVACPAAAVVPKWRRPHALVIPETGSCSPTQPRSSRRKLVLEPCALAQDPSQWAPGAPRAPPTPLSSPVATPVPAGVRRCLEETPAFAAGCGAPATSPRARAASVGEFLSRMEASAACSTHSASPSLDSLPPPAFELLRGLSCSARAAGLLLP